MKMRCWASTSIHRVVTTTAIGQAARLHPRVTRCVGRLGRLRTPTASTIFPTCTKQLQRSPPLSRSGGDQTADADCMAWPDRQPWTKAFIGAQPVAPVDTTMLVLSCCLMVYGRTGLFWVWWGTGVIPSITGLRFVKQTLRLTTTWVLWRLLLFILSSYGWAKFCMTPMLLVTSSVSYLSTILSGLHRTGDALVLCSCCCVILLEVPLSGFLFSFLAAVLNKLFNFLVTEYSWQVFFGSYTKQMVQFFGDWIFMTGFLWQLY